MSYYRDRVPDLIEQLKLMVKECLKIVGDKIHDDLTDDKMLNVIKSKKMAAENVIWASQEIDKLNLELNEEEGAEKPVKIANFAESMIK